MLVQRRDLDSGRDPARDLGGRRAQPDALPLLITHGYPSSVVEYAGLIGLLTDYAEVAFHLVIPSLPGFGFSTPLTEPGWQTGRTAGPGPS